MANFLFVYRGGTDVFAKLPPDEIQQTMQKWNDWIGGASRRAGW